jgi:hypothetical protein
MRRKFVRLSSMLLTGLVVVGGSLITGATASAGGCGHWSTSSWLGGVDHYYTHCTNDGSTVRVLVYHTYSPAGPICVGPNQTANLGWDVTGAHYDGLC